MISLNTLFVRFFTIKYFKYRLNLSRLAFQMAYFIDFSLYIFIKWCEKLEMDWHLKQFNERTLSHSRARTRASKSILCFEHEHEHELEV